MHLRSLQLVALAATAAAKLTLPADFDWSAITPTRDLVFVPCYEDGAFLCARLLVPLDWRAFDHGDASEEDPGGRWREWVVNGRIDDDDEEETVALAIIKLPATVPESDPDFGGTIFTNPGGPGGSGVGLLLSRGRYLRAVASNGSAPTTDGSGNQKREEGKKHYAVLSWDPRAVQFTSPAADCFAGDAAARLASDLQGAALGPLDADAPAALRRKYAMVNGFGRLCEDKDDAGAAGGRILPYATTAQTARDMLHMLELVEDLRPRAREGETRLPAPGQKPLHRRAQQEEEEPSRILYWGFSYGTFLGNTFASLYPGRVGRMVLDGVVDADDYVAGTWLRNLQDTEALVDYFYASCRRAGPGKCALARAAGAGSPRARVDELADRLDAAPAFVADAATGQTAPVTGAEVRAAFQRPLYSPRQGFPQLAAALARALEGNYSAVLALGLQASMPPLREACGDCPPCADAKHAAAAAAAADDGMRDAQQQQAVFLFKGNHNSTKAPPERLGADATRAISCGDSAAADTTARLTLPELAAYVARVRAQSRHLGPFWASIRFGCAGWRTRAPWRFAGPFGTPPPPPRTPVVVGFVGGSEEGGTAGGGGEGGEDKRLPAAPAAPLLFLSASLDPVTPLRNARAMAARHPGAAVLEQRSAGHCASTETSRCTAAVVGRYFDTGALPPNGTVCALDCEVWEDEGVCRRRSFVPIHPPLFP
ncbi:TAP-like protein-domain-containing protein [Xylariomycetidae sp. FL0641]|nr:TAP-like protein-domain-containing protein [Xylariomycetidae sp. FL0641]